MSRTTATHTTDTATAKCQGNMGSPPPFQNILEVTQLVVNVRAQHAAPVQKPPQVRKS